MACLIFAALSMSGHHTRTTTVNAAATTTPEATPETIAAPVSAPTTSAAPKSLVTRATSAAPLPTLSTAASPTTTTTTTAASSTTAAPAAAQVAAGDCVAAGSLAKTACGSTSSAYRVTSTGGQCPSDSDRSVPQTLPGGATNNLCMDTDWEVGRCMSMSGGAPTPASCDASTPGLVRVQGIKQGTADVNTCTDANRGVVYKQRQFVVCVVQQ